jgi:hypothetical protein
VSYTDAEIASRSIDALNRENDRMRAERDEARALLGELLDWAIDACHQGSGNAFGSSPTWHNFISTWEDADELLPRVTDALVARQDHP